MRIGRSASARGRSGVRIAALLAVLAASAAPVAAATVVYGSYAVAGDQTVEITAPGPASGQAGEFRLAADSGLIEAWCIDVFTGLLPSGAFDIVALNAVVPGAPPLTTSQIGDIGALAAQGRALVASPPAGVSADDVGAAIQIAIWKVEYPTFAYGWDAPHDAIDALAASYYANAVGGVWTPNFGLRALVAAGDANQTLVAFVPEPPVWVLTGLGFVALGWMLKRRRSPGACVSRRLGDAP